jgi:Leucine-rich repeat (LRR) protein
MKDALFDLSDMKRSLSPSLPTLPPEDPWAICQSTRVLASFLDYRELCHLSACAHDFIPFNKQIWHVSCNHWSRRLLTQMRTGAFKEVTTLNISDGSLREFKSHQEFEDALAPAFKVVPKIERLSVSHLSQSTLNKIMLQGLGTAVKPSLKSLKLCACTEAPDVSFIHGLANLVCLDFSFCFTYLPVLLPAINGDSFHHLQTLTVQICRVPSHQASSLAKLLINGKLPSLKHLNLSRNWIRDEAIDTLIATIPFLELLDLFGNKFSTAGKARLRAMAADYPDLMLEL